MYLKCYFLLLDKLQYYYYYVIYTLLFNGINKIFLIIYLIIK